MEGRERKRVRDLRRKEGGGTGTGRAEGGRGEKEREGGDVGRGQ